MKDPELYPALYVARITNDKTKHLIVYLEPVNDGMMYEYHDPTTNDVVGCVGRNMLWDFVTPFEDWRAA